MFKLLDQLSQQHAQYGITLGKLYIKKKDNPDNRNCDLFNVTRMEKLFQDNRFKIYFKLKDETQNTDDVYVNKKKLINFFKQIKDNCTLKNIAEYIPFLITINNVEVENYYPDFSEELMKTHSIRFESIIIYMITRLVFDTYSIHQLPSIMPYLYMTYQIPVEKIDQRYQDMAMEKLRIFIEIQEKNTAHKSNQNDMIKKALVNLRKCVSLIFQQVEYEKNPTTYVLEWFYTHMKPTIDAALMCVECSKVSQQFKQKLLTFHHNDHLTKKRDNANYIMKTIQDPKRKRALLKVKRQYDSYVNNGNSNSILKILFKWKEKEIQDKKHSIPLNTFLTDILRIKEEANTEQFQEIIETTYLMGYDYTFENETYYLSWNTVIMLINECSRNGEMDIDPFTFKLTLMYLLSVQNIYDTIILPQIQQYYESIIDNMYHNSTLAIDHIETKLTEKTEKEISSIKESLDKEKAKSTLITRQYTSLIKKVEKNLKSPSNKNNEKVQDHINNYNSQKNDTFALQWKMGEPIWTGMACEIIYTRNICDTVSKNTFLQYLKNKKINKNTKENILLKLTKSKQIKNLETVTMIKFTGELDNQNVYKNPLKTLKQSQHDLKIRTFFNQSLFVTDAIEKEHIKNELSRNRSDENSDTESDDVEESSSSLQDKEQSEESSLDKQPTATKPKHTKSKATKSKATKAKTAKSKATKAKSRTATTTKTAKTQQQVAESLMNI